MTGTELNDKIRVSLAPKPDEFKHALRVVKRELGCNTFDVNGLTYDFCQDTDVVTVMSKGAIVGVMTQAFFENLAKHRG